MGIVNIDTQESEIATKTSKSPHKMKELKAHIMQIIISVSSSYM